MAVNHILTAPPSHITGALGAYLQDVYTQLRGLGEAPHISNFSAASPNGLVTGYPGDLAVNIQSASLDSRVWVLGGSVRQLTNTGWVLLRTG